MRIDTKLEKLSQKALERKSNKPIMEKKRRARINHCLNQLKALILETDNERSRHSKLEKADILEMTVRYLQTLRAYHLHLQQIQHLQQQQQHQQQAHSNLHLSPHHFQAPPTSNPLQQLQLPMPLPLPLQLQTQQQQHPQQRQQQQLQEAQISPAWRPW